MLKIAWSEIFAHSLPEGHRFPMAKYDLLPEQLLYEGTITQDNLFAPEPLAEQYILDTHDATYWQRLRDLQLSPSEIRKTGFPLSEQLVQREIVIMNGTVQAALFALEFGIGMNIAGGTHHAFTDRGEGFCLLNDIAIAANHLLRYKGIKKVLVVDLDVHQGNGTAQIFRDEPRVFTFSMHGGHNYPFHKEQSDLDVPLAEGTDDKTYLKLLGEHLPRLLDEQEPEFVFFQSGVDVLATDKLGKLSMSIAGCKARDRMVLEACVQNRIPVAVSMGGGYSKQIAHIVEAHANTFRLAQQLFF
ncbi:histone deacetylase family protein [Pontibacter ramchanderi]|uniref:Acetoin utilization deacetylase AcuC-like enzyme n=1 Tax=Pontibacter ramchanderi TaxID=1179743 RepID=A0A2N3UC22_9BACT|nr:histone deacetylase [Pontibacter ramchanderi]PKV66948.1 acetoin utilization deacetylase AcuC-like enzyme [Pontibacter ramchanderi]